MLNVQKTNNPIKPDGSNCCKKCNRKSAALHGAPEYCDECHSQRLKNQEIAAARKLKAEQEVQARAQAQLEEEGFSSYEEKLKSEGFNSPIEKIRSITSNLSAKLKN